MVAINLGKIRSDAGGGATPVGTILPWSKATAPSGFLKCDGSAISRVTFADLFEVIGTTYGVGDGSTTFNIPDMQSRLPVQANASTNVGQTGGANQSALNFTNNLSITGNATIQGNPTLPLVDHKHNYGTGSGSGDDGDPSLTITPRCLSGPVVDIVGGGQAHNHNFNLGTNLTGNVTAQQVSIFQPHLVVIYIIKF